jgi:SnoaL-like domain
MMKVSARRRAVAWIVAGALPLGALSAVAQVDGAKGGVTATGEQLDAPGNRRPLMSGTISALLKRNLDVFSETDPARRRALIEEFYAEDCVFYDPNQGSYRGRDAIDRIAGAIKATHPDFKYQLIAEPEVSGDAGRIQWVEGRPGQAPAVAGTDFIVARDSRIAAIYLFFDQLPRDKSRD